MGKGVNEVPKVCASRETGKGERTVIKIISFDGARRRIVARRVHAPFLARALRRARVYERRARARGRNCHFLQSPATLTSLLRQLMSYSRKQSREISGTCMCVLRSQSIISSRRDFRFLVERRQQFFFFFFLLRNASRKIRESPLE